MKGLRSVIEILGIMLLANVELSACDVCGCNINGHQFGILPLFQKHFVGIRYKYNSFRSTHPPLFSNETVTFSNEYFSTIDIWARYNLGQRWQVFGYLPYQYSKKVEDGVSSSNDGIGDLTLLAMYNLINQKRSEDRHWVQNLQIGGGLKLPTGNNDFLDQNNDWIPGIQTGTGSVDLLVNANYVIRFDAVGLSLEASYRHNTKDKDHDFKYGDRWVSGLRGFYIFTFGSSSIMPSFGASLDYAKRDFHEGAWVDLSGGYFVSGQIGIDYFIKNVMFGIQYAPVIQQDVAFGNLKANPKFHVQCALSF